MVVFASGLLRGQALLSQLAIGASVAIAAVPEGLPLLAGVGEAAVARRLATRKALVRRLAAVEGLGRVDIACTDKTGTLTEGKLSLHEVATIDADGSPGSDLSDDLRVVLRAAGLASPHPDTSGAAAHPTDVAVIRGAEQAGLGEEIRAPHLQESPFDPARAYHATVTDGHIWVKGAVEVLLPRCRRVRIKGHDLPLGPGRQQALTDRANELAARGLRLLMVAEGPSDTTLDDPHHLVALGFVGISDPLRPGVPAAVQRCHEAGVRVIMLTGDHPITARAIAWEAGLLDGAGEVITGADIAELQDDDLGRRLERAAVVARVTPLDKLPIVVFALLGSSRHLVVGADSATAAILAGGTAGLAAQGSPRYVALAGLSALLAGAFLLAARLIRLGFLANFLSRTVLIGFLTGVGIQVASGQLAEMLGVRRGGSGTIEKFINTIKAVPHTSVPTLIVSLAVLAVIIGVGRLTRRIPGALIAVIGAIVVSWAAHLSSHGVAVLGPVPQGLPRFGLPNIALGDASLLIGTAASMFVVILAQSAATSRAYAARYDEEFSENRDLVGLGMANIAAGLSGTFVVNGSPTKTEMVDGAGGTSQLAQLTTAVVVFVVLLFLTGPLKYLPSAVLASIVFLIGVELIHVGQMHAILEVRRDEFVVATLTAAAVVFVGVEQGIILAIVLSIIDHLRYSYHPKNAVLVSTDEGHLRSTPARPGERTTGGLLIYRFGSSLYYANAHSLYEDVTTFLDDGQPLSWFCLDAVAIGDIDYSAAQMLRRVHHALQARNIRFCLSNVADYVREELQDYQDHDITALLAPGILFQSPADVVEAYHQSLPGSANQEQPGAGTP